METNAELISVMHSAARHLAQRGLHGDIGDPLPMLMTVESVNYINSNIEAFRHAVSVQRIILRCIKTGNVRRMRQVTA